MPPATIQRRRVPLKPLQAFHLSLWKLERLIQALSLVVLVLALLMALGMGLINALSSPQTMSNSSIPHMRPSYLQKGNTLCP